MNYQSGEQDYEKQRGRMREDVTKVIPATVAGLGSLHLLNQARQGYKHGRDREIMQARDRGFRGAAERDQARYESDDPFLEDQLMELRGMLSRLRNPFRRTPKAPKSAPKANTAQSAPAAGGENYGPPKKKPLVGWKTKAALGGGLAAGAIGGTMLTKKFRDKVMEDSQFYEDLLYEGPLGTALSWGRPRLDRHGPGQYGQAGL